MQKRIALGLRLALAAVFLLAAVAKSIDLNAFYLGLTQFPLGLSVPSLLLVARLAVALELAIGLALLSGLYLDVVLPLTVVLLATFTGLNVWYYVARLGPGCACFGSLLKRGPVAAMTENLVLMIVSFLVWGLTGPDRNRSRARAAMVAGFFLMGLALPLLFPKNAPRAYNAGNLGSYLGDVPVEGLGQKLGQDRLLVALLDFRDEQSRSVVATLNELAAMSGAPRVLGLCPNTPAYLDSLGLVPRMAFPTGFVFPVRFRSLAGNAPTLLFLKEGVVRRAWPVSRSLALKPVVEACEGAESAR